MSSLCKIAGVKKITLAQAKFLELYGCSNGPGSPVPVVYVWKKYIVDGCATLKTLLQKYKTPLERSNIELVVVELECENPAVAIATRIAINKRYDLCNAVLNISPEHRRIIDDVCIGLQQTSHEVTVNSSSEEDESEKDTGVCKKPKFESHEKELLKDERILSKYCAGYKKITIPLPLYYELKKRGHPTLVAVELLEKSLFEQ